MFSVIFAAALQVAIPHFEALPNAIPYPRTNSPSPMKIELGKQLFFDSRISENKRTSCLSCHNIQTSGENNRPFSLKPNGTPSKHSVPTVFNAAFLSTYFWYGTAASLEEQAEGPLEEMELGHL